jgi:hypothetical protein
VARALPTVVVVTALAVSVVVTPVAANSGTKIFALRANDGFDIAQPRIACVVQKRPIKNYPFNTLICFKETAPLSYEPKAGTYGLVVDEVQAGVTYYEAKARARRVFSVPQPHATGRPAVAAEAVPLAEPAGVARLRRGDGVYLIGTHIVCLYIGQPVRLTCGDVGASGAVNRSYYTLMDGSGVRVVQVRGKSLTFVFRGTNH